VGHFAAPKGLPKEIATQYETAIKKVWDSAAFKEFMKADNEETARR
jgi:tripartite-type tricarboxylate transporter receptor subunit TctC